MNNDDIVRFVNLKKEYILGKTNKVPVLKGINLSIKKGEFIGIMGTSGSGKSTLLNILGLLDVPTSGEYFLDNIHVETLSDDERAVIRNKKIGFIFQNFNLFPHLTTQKNIEVPLVYGEVDKKKRAEIAFDMAQKVHLHHRLDHKPGELSGGEKQRIAVARALANSPSFLLADEPTGNLDEKTSKEIIDLFHELHKVNKSTIVMVTHNPEYESIFDRVIHLRDGKVVEK